MTVSLICFITIFQNSNILIITTEIKLSQVLSKIVRDKLHFSMDFNASTVIQLLHISIFTIKNVCPVKLLPSIIPKYMIVKIMEMLLLLRPTMQRGSPQYFDLIYDYRSTINIIINVSISIKPQRSSL
jgi:hypothetical protein